MSTNVGLAISLLETRAPASLEVPRSLRAGLAQIGTDELLVLERPTEEDPFASSRPTPGARFAGLHAIHACYASEPTTEGWLRRVLSALQPLAPSARWFGWSDGRGRDLGPGIVLPDGADVATSPAAADVLGAVGRECYRDLLRPRPPVQLLSHRLRSLPTTLERRVAEILRSRGLPDAVMLFGGELDGQAIALGMVVMPGVRSPSRTIGLLRNVAGHLNTARRLRGRLPLAGRAAGAPRAGASALAVGDARSTAPAVVAELDGAQSIAWAAADAPETTRLWGAFVGGAYALVDHWVAGGHRWILARRCQDSGDPAALRPAEAAALAYVVPGLQTAEVGELLGISAATVTLHLTSARARLRCGSRRELVALVSSPALDG
jgi:DNA-binding CsgD family transcriptional regulator